LWLLPAFYARTTAPLRPPSAAGTRQTGAWSLVKEIEFANSISTTGSAAVVKTTRVERVC
jgi:hypothetical protein